MPFPGILNQSDKMLTYFRETVETCLHPCLNRTDYTEIIDMKSILQFSKLKNTQRDTEKALYFSTCHLRVLSSFSCPML